ncbi:fibronectin type III domain-containing protein [Geomonas limicola]|uniref:fibronectin type III domain-containing protein n=1 Tax=Geomonas limicola TaxID=2740186 RepID=UPI00160EB56C|nr:fibronectin type III domain-containing protein [Geomonas limicola]
MLAFLSLLFAGCGDYSSSSPTPPQPQQLKTVSGYVSNSVTGLALPGAVVTAYGVDANGVQASAPLAGSSFGVSDQNGMYSLKIPASYVGTLVVKATLPTSGVGKRVAGLSTPAPTPLRAAISITGTNDVLSVMISYATDAAVQLIENNATAANLATGFTPTGFSADNVLKANRVLEAVFGTGFNIIQPPSDPSALGTSSTGAQNLVVAIQAFNQVLVSESTSTSQIVTLLVTTGLGSGISDALVNAIQDVVSTDLSSVLPPSFQPSPAIISSITDAGTTPVTVPVVSDTTPASAPASVTATAVSSTQVSVTWTASSDAESGIANYIIYRSVNSGAFEQLAVLAGSATSYLDTSAAPQTAYQYKMTAVNGTGLTSAYSNVASVSTPADPNAPDTQIYTLTGRITANGVGVVNVKVDLTGSGTGSATTDSNGDYSFYVLSGSYTVQPDPQQTNYLFTPLSKTVTVAGASVSGQDFTAAQTGSAGGSVTYPSGSANGSVTYPDGSFTTGIVYPTGVVIGGVSYPAGTVVVSIHYPNGALISGVNYPAGTVISTVSYPGGVVVGGVTYPGGSTAVVVTYPNGTITTKIVFASGNVLTSTAYPTGTFSVSIIYASGTVVGGVTYPAGTVVTQVTYPSGAVIGNVTYPAGTIFTTVSSPSGGVGITIGYPDGSVGYGLDYNNSQNNYTTYVP